MGAYSVTVLGGLEEIARREIEERLSGAEVRPAATRGERGRVHFEYGGPPTDVLALRSVVNVFAALDEASGIPADESGLEAIRQRAAQLDLGPALELHAAAHGPRTNPSFRCTSKRLGAQTYGSMEIMAAAGAAIVERYGWRVDLEGHDYDIHVDVDDDRLTIGLRLSPESLHHRSRVVHLPASLNPTLGYAMCVLSGPQPCELFVDPTCGAGTILIERAAVGPARLCAGDIFAHPVEAAHRNFEVAAVKVGLCRWDARRLPLRDGSVDKVCANLPWGRRAGSHTVNKHLYPRMVREFARVLRIDGLAVVLTLEKQMLIRCVGRHGWLRLERSVPVSVGGLRPAIYCIRKWREHERPQTAE